MSQEIIEQKANEITERNYTEGESQDSYQECKKSALDMADWFEDQTIKWINRTFHATEFGNIICRISGGFNSMNDLINDFKNELK